MANDRMQKKRSIEWKIQELKNRNSDIFGDISLDDFNEIQRLENELKKLNETKNKKFTEWIDLAIKEAQTNNNKKG